MKYCETCHSSYPTEFTTCPKDQSALRIASELLQGMVIRDKYRIEEKIGAGGMATVYRARHLAFNEERAIKVVGSRLADDPDFIRRFKTEAIVTRKLQHPNAVRVDDLDTTEDGRPFIVMEYVRGCDLRAVIQQEGPLPLKRALHIAWQVGSALATAHQLGITHRDIKPDNILLVAQPSGMDLAKVLDFGIAKVREGSFEMGEGYTPTQTGMVVGTPQYISPEQAMGKHGDQIDGRADLYSLGVVLYECLTGRLPFESDTPVGLLLHHIQTRPTPPHQLRPELNIPPHISRCLMKLLEKDPNQRFQNAGEMLDALTRPSAAEVAAATTAGSAIPTQATKVLTPTQMGRSAAAATPAATSQLPPTAAQCPASVAVPARRRAAAPPQPASRKGLTAAVLGAILLAALGGVAFLRRQHAQPAATPVPTPAATVPSEPAPAATSPPAETPSVASPVTTSGTPPHPAARKPAETPVAAEPQPEPSTEISGQPAEQTPPRRGLWQQGARSAREERPGVWKLLKMGKRQFDNGEYRAAAASFQAALELDSGNLAAQEGLRRARERLREQQQEQRRWRQR